MLITHCKRTDIRCIKTYFEYRNLKINLKTNNIAASIQYGSKSESTADHQSQKWGPGSIHFLFLDGFIL